MKFFENNKNMITKDESSENVPHLEITEVVLIHCNVVSNDYQQDSKVLYPFDSNKSFGQLLDISPKKIIFSKKLLIQNFHIFKYGLVIKILNHQRQKIK